MLREDKTLSKTAIIFPGQGAQTVGMGKDVAEASPAARRVFEDADNILGTDLSTLCFDGPAQRLNDTDMSQPAIFVTSVAIWRALEAGGRIGEFALPPPPQPSPSGWPNRSRAAGSSRET